MATTPENQTAQTEDRCVLSLKRLQREPLTFDYQQSKAHRKRALGDPEEGDMAVKVMPALS